MSRLRHSRDDEPGITRERAGCGFRYRDANGRVIRDGGQLQRIRALAVPPAYRQVWICADPCGHLQATGRDARGRKQYRYHPEWRRQRDDQKFERVLAFAEALPKLRRRVQRDLRAPGLPRDKVLATVVTLLDLTQARVGNAEYARDNRSYGLTTLRDCHAKFVRDGRLRLSFAGKGGTPHDLIVDDRRLARIVRRCQQLPGQVLFQYLDDDGMRHPIDSGQLNQYLQDASGDAFTAKDFRTWAATMRAAVLLGGVAPDARHARAGTVRINQVIAAVADVLRNTPAICRKSYINPLVFDIWRGGGLRHLPRCRNAAQVSRRVERAIVEVLRRHGRPRTRRSN